MHTYLSIDIKYNGQTYTFNLGKATIVVRSIEEAIGAINKYNGI